ncbi:UNVERIFIED_CONTAM: cation:proton antiporter [Campylobacter lari]
MLLGPSVFNIMSKELMDISKYLRQIALLIILTRAGLKLNLKALKKVGVPALLLSFIPASCEIIGIVIFGPIFLKISYLEAALLGSVLAAVSPAIIVPRMIKIKDESYGNKNNITDMVLLGASIDDIFVIVLFYSIKGLLVANRFDSQVIINIPLGIFFGALIGLIIGYILSVTFKKLKSPTVFKVLITLGLSFLLIFAEDAIKHIISYSSLISIIVLGVVILFKNPEDAEKIQKGYTNL